MVHVESHYVERFQLTMVVASAIMSIANNINRKSKVVGGEMTDKTTEDMAVELLKERYGNTWFHAALGLPIHKVKELIEIGIEKGKTAGRDEGTRTCALSHDEVDVNCSFCGEATNPHDLTCDKCFSDEKKSARQAGREERENELFNCGKPKHDNPKVVGCRYCHNERIATLSKEKEALEAQLSLCKDVARSKNLMDVKKIGRLATVELKKENARLRDALEKMDICPDCLGAIAVANPTGNCNHVYYPEYKKKASEEK